MSSLKLVTVPLLIYFSLVLRVYPQNYDEVRKAAGVFGHLPVPVSSDLEICHFPSPTSRVWKIWCPARNECSSRTESEVLLGNLTEPFRKCQFNSGSHLSTTDGKKKIRFEVIEFLAISDGKVAQLENNYFCDLKKLKSLDLSANSLFDMEKLGLCVDKKRIHPPLTRLLLSSNNFTRITWNWTTGRELNTLIILLLNKCEIDTIETDAFSNLKRLQWLDLSRNKLSSLPVDVFRENKELAVLHIRHNQLTATVMFSLGQLPKLQLLYLDHNRIEGLENATSVFKSMTSLQKLKLDVNLLTSLNDELSSLSRLTYLKIQLNRLSNISSVAFQNLTRLMYLDLSSNQLCDLPYTIFDNNSQLSDVIIANNSLRKFPNFKNVRNLKDLQASMNLIPLLNKTIFSKNSRLIEINLANNRISFVENGTFDGLKNLYTLKLSSNRLNDIVSKTFSKTYIENIYLDHNNLTEFSFSDFSPTLKRIAVNHNQISKLNYEGFVDSYNVKREYLREKQWKLEDLDLSYNKLTSLSGLLLPPLVSKVNLRNNQIKTITYHDEFLKLRQLYEMSLKVVELHLQNNSFVRLCEKLALTKDLNFRLSGNPLDCSCENAWMRAASNLLHTSNSNFSLSVVDLNDLTCKPMMNKRLSNELGTSPVKLTQVNPDQFLCKTGSHSRKRCQCSAGLHRLRCYFTCPQPCTCFSTHDLSLVHFFCSKSNMTKVPANIDYDNLSPKVRIILWLDGNEFPLIARDEFLDYPGLIRLYLNHSNVRTIEENAFDNLTKLEVLHLDNNFLKLLPSNIFDKLTYLTELYLSNNSLKHLSEDIFSNLPFLKVLSLCGNQLTDFQPWKLASLKSIEKLSLHENPWSCDCLFVEKFRQFFQNYTKVISSVDRLFCTELNGSEEAVPLINFNSSQCYNLGRSVVINAFYLPSVWVTVLVCVICLTVFVVLIFYYRKEMQILIYSRYGVRIFNRNSGKDETDGKIYDAFVSYSSEDMDFMFYELLPGLEGIENPYHLCIHDRDFLGGAYINDSIVEAVQKSSRTIILLTPNFVNSGWCRFEFKTAHVQMLHDRCPRVLVIVVGEIPENLDEEMKLYLKTNTYLQWGEKLFWKKLYYAMPDKRIELSTTESQACLQNY